MYREGVSTPSSAAGHTGSEGQAETADVAVPMMSLNHFIDAKVLNTKHNMLHCHDTPGNSSIRLFKTITFHRIEMIFNRS